MKMKMNSRKIARIEGAASSGSGRRLLPSPPTEGEEWNEGEVGSDLGLLPSPTEEESKMEESNKGKIADFVPRERPLEDWSSRSLVTRSPTGELFTMFWDPDDPATWSGFSNHVYRDCLLPRHCLLSTSLPLVSGKKISDRHIFELYSIEIKRLDRHRREDFHMIVLCSGFTHFVPIVIYKRPKRGEEDIDAITGGRPLLLKGPLQLPYAEEPVTIELKDRMNRGGWCFAFYPEYDKFKYDEPLSAVFKDNECDDNECEDSEALISYEIIKEAAKAMLTFRFIDADAPIQILSGTISAAHGGENQSHARKRIVKHFPSHKPPAVVNTNHILPVDRNVFGVPLGSRFQVTAENLICTTTTTPPPPPLVGGGGEEQGGSRCFRIHGTLYFDVPTHIRSEEQSFTSTDDSSSSTRLRLTVSWTKPLP